MHIALHQAPAIPWAGAMYDIIVAYGIRPEVALAFYHHESSCGMEGRARTTRSFGNLRWKPEYQTFFGTPEKFVKDSPYWVMNLDGFVAYQRYTDAADHFCRHLTGQDGTDFYRSKFGVKMTTEQVVPIWAPSADGNVPKAYLAALWRFVGEMGGDVADPEEPAEPTEEATLIDIRHEIPRADWSIGFASPKTSVTVHWNGGAVDENADPFEVIRADAQFHINKNWGDSAHPAYGDGLMYHRMYARDGRVFQTRDDDAVLYHCGASGNSTSFAWQVMTGSGQNATPAQMASLRRDLAAMGLPAKGHRDWSPTQCPGDEIYALVYSDWEEEDMPFSTDPDAQFFKNDVNNSIVAIKDVLKTLSARIDAIGGVVVAPPPANAPTREELIAAASKLPAPDGFHWEGKTLVPNPAPSSTSGTRAWMPGDPPIVSDPNSGKPV